ncbi:hypothetical protein PQO03_12360 [Lentisphaera profundi]|uniref:DUF7133 domain-containing protein n=1 Tax=Lentisphaera profundi TaxID=1658616 RepID=A0ABY7VWL6_9BACT|nr:hypothetical protein [Lentisphaera profundi]WDE98630.1 hypothetical protein PQO03_12360 [Lentisphaera profundi]
MFKQFFLTFLITCSFILSAANENDYYTITDIPVPEGFEVTCIEVLPNKKIAVGSRRGDIYIIENAYDNDPKNDKWTLFATGIHEPLGLSYYKGWLWCTQRPEVTRMKDVDGDGFADKYECISDDWGINGNYHEYAFGTKHDKEGNIWVVLCLTGSGGAASDFRGWCVRINENGDLIPTASGIRSPGGMGINHLGDVFYSDNQGLWNGTSSVKHLKIGSFQGNPTGNKFYSLTDEIGPKTPDPKSGGRIVTERETIKDFVPPAANLPHQKLGTSTSGIACDTTNGKFGPFQNQLFANDQGQSLISRLALEQVNGVYQGMAIKFREGFGSGNVPAVMSPDGALFIGGTNRGWNSTGRKPGALERVNWTGKTPFEVHHMQITKTGFNLVFTEKIDPASLTSESIKANANTWIYQSGYGSPEVDIIDLKITDVKFANDAMSAHITLDKIYKGHTHNFDFGSIKSAKGNPLLHSNAYYTVNEVLGEVHIVPAVNPAPKKKKKVVKKKK